MQLELFSGQTKINARAMFLGQRLDLRAFEDARLIAAAPIVITAGAAGCAVLFRYGVAVVFNLSAIEEVAFMGDLKNFIVAPFESVQTEHLEIRILGADPNVASQEGISNDTVQLHEISVAHIQLIADLLAKSVVLAHYEVNIADSFDRIEPLAMNLQQGHSGGRKARELLSHIGQTLAIQSKMVARVEIEEKPGVLWESPHLERLYVRCEDYYELTERHKALERKLELISRTAETLLGLLMHKRTLHVEWYIVALIVIEVVLMSYEIYLSSGGGH